METKMTQEDKIKQQVAREISIAASAAGLTPHDLAKADDWKKAVEAIRDTARAEVMEEIGKEAGRSEVIEEAKKTVRISKRGKNYVQFSNGILVYVPKSMVFGERITIRGIHLLEKETKGNHQCNDCFDGKHCHKTNPKCDYPCCSPEKETK